MIWKPKKLTLELKAVTVLDLIKLALEVLDYFEEFLEVQWHDWYLFVGQVQALPTI